MAALNLIVNINEQMDSKRIVEAVRARLFNALLEHLFLDFKNYYVKVNADRPIL